MVRGRWLDGWLRLGSGVAMRLVEDGVGWLRS